MNAEVCRRPAAKFRGLRRWALVLAFALGIASYGLCAQSAQGSPLTPWALSVSPVATFPLAQAGSLFGTAFGGTADIEYALKHPSGLGIGARLGYMYNPLHSDITALSDAISEASLSGVASYTLPLAPRLSGRLFAGCGAVFGMVDGDAGSSTVYGSAEGGAGLDFELSPQWAIRLSASWVQKLGLYGGLCAGLGVSWTVPEPAKPEETGRKALRLLDFADVELGSVFPIMQTYYDDHPVGTVRLKNGGKEKASSVKVSFFVRQFMDAPKACGEIADLGPGESKDLSLYALFGPSILDLTEATKASAEVTVEYMAEGSPQSQTYTTTLRVYDRNAMTWDDDRKAAAFVSGKDPWVLDLSNNIVATVKNLRNAGLPKNLQTAMAFHAGLRQYGLSYVTNPKNPFAQAFANPETVDFLKFPRQTLHYKAGDCSDLSILYASFFESVGIETAFITIPGHIFMAYSLDAAPEGAKGALSASDDLIIKDGKVWMPLEVTMRDSDLMGIWREAAREWHQGISTGAAAFYPIHEAWKTFAPVGLAADATGADPVSMALVATSFEAELAKLVDQEVRQRAAAYDAAIGKQPSPKAYNERGVIYARFGKLEEAEKDFKAATARYEYAPALVNLGSVSFMKRNVEAAYGAYQRAARLLPDNAGVQINLAKTAALLGKRAEAAQALEKATRLNPQLAGEYSSVAAISPDAATRAADKSDASPIWISE